MKIEQVGDRRHITIHQSFMNTHMMCPKMARHPGGPSSESAIGTAMHAAIEAHVSGLEPKDVRDHMVDAYRIETEMPDFTRNMDDAKALVIAAACFAAWKRDIAPRLGQFDGDLEHKFKYHVDSRGDVDLFIGGQWDALIEGELWDWKTAASMYKYKQWEVDRFHIQPTMYTWALAIMTDDWSPKRFNYGIVEKSAKPKGHVVSTRREASDWMWMLDQMWSVVDSWDSPPSLNDQGWHCSLKWCALYSSCKGAPRLLKVGRNDLHS
jgi:PD-(D/E)XK nuclease superfamily